MLDTAHLQALISNGRVIGPGVSGDTALGALALLPEGKWSNLPSSPGHGWNMIALPFAGNNPFHYRLLLNQFNEELIFSTVDKGVPNRGINPAGTIEEDQFVAALQYIQNVVQVQGEDFPVSGKVAVNGSAIHHEPGLWLHLTNQVAPGGNDLARLGTVPHGDSLLALGTSSVTNGAPVIPVISGLPIGESTNPTDLNNPYLAPYKHFNNHPFRNVFNPVIPNALLTAANQGVNIVKTTQIHVSTTTETGGIVNIPFIKSQANAAQMDFTMWIQELAEKDGHGKPKLRLQYSQTVFLEFFPRRDGKPGLIRWPHVSINTLEKVL